jgi:hypothetical protein
MSNKDVLKPYVNGRDLMDKPRDVWLIDFFQMSQEEASEYLVPFQHVQEKVKPVRDNARRNAHRIYWWRHHDTRPAMRAAFKDKKRYICTCIVAKHRVWRFLPTNVLPDKAIAVIGKDDDYTFGVLHSRIHEIWALSVGTWLGKGNDPRYTPSTCFETFPFPEPTDAQHADISKWAKYLDETRQGLLEKDDNLTMTKLYNKLTDLRASRDSANPVYALLVAHERLDAAVAAAYGWDDWEVDKETILERLLALNLERAAQEKGTT